jgi:hypothetical protein
MDYFLRAVGFLVVAGMASAAIACIVYFVSEWANARQEARFREWVKTANEAFGHRLVQDGYWFSEDAPTMKLIQHIGEEIARHGELAFNVGEARERWRDARVVTEGEARKVPA